MTDQVVDGQNEETVKPASDNLFADQLSGIKNEEGKQKYSDVGTALNALANSQEYIPTLKGELSQKDAEIQALKEKLAATEAVEDVVKRLQQSERDTGQAPPAAGLDQEAILELARQAIRQEGSVAASLANEKKVTEVLKSKFGDKAGEVLKQKAQELGMSIEDMQALARKSPNAVTQFFSAPAPAAGAVSSSSINVQPNMGGGDVLAPPEKSMLSGATYKEQLAYLNAVRAHVYKKLNVEK